MFSIFGGKPANSWILAFARMTALGLTAALLVSPPAVAQSDSAAKCAALATTEFGGIQDAPTQVMSAKYAPATTDLPAHCDIIGNIQPHIGIQMRLPDAWNGKFLKQGCGGLCGGLLTAGCDEPLRRGYACIVSDMGHKSTPLDGKWAYNNLQAEFDFGIRATHVNAVAGTAITEHYYGKAPARSFYNGCSTGGRQGMVEAQRFPYDFDGIIAGAPVIDETGDAMTLVWSVLALQDKAGKPLVSSDDLRLVNRAAIAKCDADDGLKDGIIGDPRTCSFDPKELQCKGAKTKDCLTQAQADGVRKVYQGPVNSKGQALYTGGALPGSELNWIQQYVVESGISTYERFMGDLFRYMGFSPDPGPEWKLSDFDFDRDYKRIGMMEALYTGSNPDLRKFKAAGGKLLSYQGWDDQSVVPLNVVDYYDTTVKTMGGRAATEAFFRLFAVPGMNHCTGGVGAWAIDYLSAMEAWVEKGVAPDMLLAIHPNRALSYPTRFPIDPAGVKFSRPVYPYPVEARYAGQGDPNDAANFRPHDPTK